MTVKFERFTLVFWSWSSGDQLNIVTEVVGLISCCLERLFRGFQYSHFYSGSLAELISSHRSPLWILFPFFVCLLVCFVDVYVTTSLYNCLLEVSVDDILSQIYNNPHIYTQIHTHILTYIHTPTHLHIKFCLQYIIAVVLMISSYDKFYQQYIDSLLNYKKLEKLIAIKRKKNK